MSELTCSKHERYDPTCFACKIRTLRFQLRPAPASLKERRWQRDHAAYRRLRRDGLQPRSIDGSADLESRAASRDEIEVGHLFTPEQLSQYREGMEQAAELREEMA